MSAEYWGGDDGVGPETLSPEAKSAWAKYDLRTEGWLPLWQHMADSGAVAALLWARWIPRNVQALVAEALPGGDDDARLLAVWLATVHDIGKATPAFAVQVDGLAQRMRKEGLAMPDMKRFGDDRRIAPHGLAGQVLFQEWLCERPGWSARTAGQFAVAIGGHHGVPPDHLQIHSVGLHPELLRTPGSSERVWRRVQWELLDACASTCGVVERLAEWRSVRLPQPVQVVLGALVIVADWIASSSELFPYFDAEGGFRSGDARLADAWRELDLPPRWSALEPEVGAAELFAARFALPADASIRPVQAEAVRLAREMPCGGLMIIEAPMGEGKTEAALAVAEVFAGRVGAGGCFVALPTRATGDAMFGRVMAWLKRLPGESSRTVGLAHAKAALNKDFADLTFGRGSLASIDCDGRRAMPRPGREEPPPVELVAHQWLRGRKKAMLSSFVVGTIDQLLFAGLKTRHLALRHLALAGKVVVIDEVHAYDAYMSTYLERVLSWLGAYRVPVVMLSATLPSARRQALVEAYAGSGATPVTGGVSQGSYPLVTAVGRGMAPVTASPSAAAERSTSVVVEALSDDDGVLADRLEAELSGGGCALVIRNTVDRVLATAELLRERFGVENVTVAHSRFVDLDRARKDADLLDRFGPDGDRPTDAHIVVASQVAEQSLDIDFDLLVTDLAPVDLILQRIGRLHRHQRGTEQRERPTRLRTARCLVTGVDWQATPPEPVPGSVAVYQGHYLMLRTLAALSPYLAGDTLHLPGDIGPLVQQVYGDAPIVPAEWAAAEVSAKEEYDTLQNAQRLRADAFRLAEVRQPGRPLIGWLEAGLGDQDDTREGRAQVRDSDETLEVLVVQRRGDGTVVTLPWLPDGLGGLEVPTDAVPAPRTARAVAASGLRLPHYFSKPWVMDRAIRELEALCVPAWQVKECHWLAGELVLYLDEDCRTRLAGYELHYSETDGLRVTPVGAREVRLVNNVPSFDLVARPWLPVQRRDGTLAELSLREVFTEAGQLRRLVGDVPTQEFALLRLLLAIVHDAVDGPADAWDWSELWNSEEPFAAVLPYLDRHRARFDLLHPETPFFQTAGLHTESNSVSSLNAIVADVPNGAPFFTMRMPNVDRLSFAEAARWVVHAHAFDTSGIKSGAVGDPRVKGGKGYPQGIGWSGNLGAVFAEGDSLRETLLLNLIGRDMRRQQPEAEDLPAWRRPPCGAAATPQKELMTRPSGPCDLYTWQSRRILLHHDTAAVTGVVLAYGDPLIPNDPQRGSMHNAEPMTGWRRSKPQEKKLGRTPVYMPRTHDPARAAWRGLPSLLNAASVKTVNPGAGEYPDSIQPLILEWLAALTTEGDLPSGSLLRTRIVGAVYGTQQSVIDEIIDDSVTMAVIVLNRQHPLYGATAVNAVDDADNAVTALGNLAYDLARATGADPEGPRDTARDLGFAALDGPFRLWLRDLGGHDDPHEARKDWQRTAHRRLRELADVLIDSAGAAAAEGRVIEKDGKSFWLDSSHADIRFRGRLNKALNHPFADAEAHDPPVAVAATAEPGMEKAGT